MQYGMQQTQPQTAPGMPSGMPSGMPPGMPPGMSMKRTPSAAGLNGGCGGCGGHGSSAPSAGPAHTPPARVTGSTISDQEVKVQDPSGRIMPDFQRYATFDSAPFPDTIQETLRRAGFPAPSQIQQYCWPLAMQNRDVIGVAATGSGKTISFLLPAFTYILEERIQAGPPLLCV